MSARVVYKGDGEYEGTLFNGLKFWVSLQLPTRESFVKDLKVFLPKLHLSFR